MFLKYVKKTLLWQKNRPRHLSRMGQSAAVPEPGRCGEHPAGVKHWHGAAADCWFSHLAIEVPGEGAHTEWFDADTEI